MRRNSLRTAALACLAAVLCLSASASMQGPGGGPRARQMFNGREVAGGEALVRFRDPIRPPGLAGLRANIDGEVVERIGSTGVVRVRSRSLDAATLVERLSRRPDVLYAEPNYIVRTFSAPNDISFPQLWGLENTGQAVNGGLPGTAGSDIRAVAAWDVSMGSTAHVVGVIDTGIDYTHADLIPNLWTAPAAFSVDLGDGTIVNCAAGTHGFDAITRTCDPMDNHGHGTHVAGTIGASGNNGLGVVGVNWTTQLMALKFLDGTGEGNVANAIAAIRFAAAVKRAFPATADVRVLSASWGGLEFSQALRDEIAAVEADDMLFVAAAGNYGLSNDSLPIYPASYDAPNIVSVAATTNSGSRAFFSNYGPTTVHLGAPGADILSTVPGNSYGFSSGTSMAAPHVSGAAALVLSRCQYGTAALKDALIGAVQPMEALDTQTITGGGLDVNSAIHSCISAPPAPVLTAIAGDGHVRLSWTAALGATGYTVKRSMVSGGPYDAIAPDVKGARYTDDDVVNGTTYYYVVSATNPVGGSPDSNEAFATPAAPSDLVISVLTAPSSAGAGATVDVTVTTANNGGGVAPATTTRIYLSSNGVFDGGDLPLNPAHSVPVLQPGAAIPATLAVTIPADTASGTHYLIAVADTDRLANESIESNNTRARSVGIGPDLRITSFSAPTSAAPGVAIAVFDTVTNQGAGSAPSSVTRFYLSVNSTLDASDTHLGPGRTVPALAAGAGNGSESSILIPANTIDGTYYLIGKADGDDAVTETNEFNNTVVRSLKIGGDLVVSAFTAPSVAGAGRSISVTDTTRNQGTAVTEASVTRFYLSDNTTVDAADVLLGERAVPSLAGGASDSATTPLTIPPATPTAGYYLLAIADAEGTVAESVESNNRSIRSIGVGPDLRVSSVTAPASAGGGASIVVSDTTVNQGGGAIGATATRYYFSTNASLDAQDVSLGARPVPGLDAGANHTGSATLTIPANATTGTYYIIAKADGNDAASETQESNNALPRSIQVGGDLRITALSAPAKGGAGLQIVVSDTTANQGTATVPASVTRFYLSPNGGLDPSDTLFAAGRAVPALAAGASSSGATTLTIPAGVGAGTYYLFAKADGDDAVGETQETNNTALRSIQIGPDLTVSAVSGPMEAAPGSAISVTDTTANDGGGAAPPSVTTFFLSSNTGLDAGDTPLGATRPVGALSPGQSSAGATSLTIPANTTPGLYYIIAKADGDDATVETQELNNTRIRSLRVGPDLAVSAASIAWSTVEAGSSATVTDTVVNQGAGLSAPSTTRFYLSLDGTLDSTDVLVPGSRSVPPLETSATSAGPTVITIPAGVAPGTYYLLGKADADDTAAESVETNNARLVRRIQITVQ